MSRPSVQLRRINDRRRLWSIATVLAVFVVVGPAPTSAAEANPDDIAGAAHPKQPTQPISNAAKIQELQKRIDERDALIADLLRRVKRLERQVAAPLASHPKALSLTLTGCN
jgi:hypothetical protein